MNPFLEALAMRAPASDAWAVLDEMCAGNPGKRRAVVNMPADDDTRSGGYYPLHYASQNGDARMVAWLLKSGANPNAVKNNGASPLMCAVFSAGSFAGMPPSDPQFAMFGRRLMDDASLSDYEACVRVLLEHPQFDPGTNDGASSRRRDCHSAAPPLLPLVGVSTVIDDEGVSAK